MSNALLDHDLLLRVGFFAAAFGIMAVAETIWPRRRRIFSRLARWPANLTIIGLGIVAVRLLAAAAQYLAIPLVAAGAAVLAERNGWGLLNWIATPAWLEFFIAVVALDFAIWLQHLLSHRISGLWLFHRMHHADRDFDVTTALRFHPIEIGLSMLYKVVWVIALGASVPAVVAFEIILNALAIFNHANVSLPLGMDRVLRSVIVTPDMHRVHHSVLPREHHANFGFNLSIWDRLFATYVGQPSAGHDGMTIGLAPYQSSAPTRLGWSLALPFRRDRTA